MNTPQKNICVFTGSRRGARPEYIEAARELATNLVSRGYGLVYGGGNVGLMGIVADAVLERHGHVIGVIPEAFIEKEVAHRGLPDLRIVKSMHERKALMAELSQGFAAMPGGLGTMEELFEVLSWAQLGLHEKPCGLRNIQGYYDSLVEFLNYAVDEEFLKLKHRELLFVESAPAQLLDRFEQVIATRGAGRFEADQT